MRRGRGMLFGGALHVVSSVQMLIKASKLSTTTDAGSSLVRCGCGMLFGGSLQVLTPPHAMARASSIHLPPQLRARVVLPLIHPRTEKVSQFLEIQKVLRVRY